MKKYLFAVMMVVSTPTVFAASYSWYVNPYLLIEGFPSGEIHFDFIGCVVAPPRTWIADANGRLFGYQDNETFFLKKCDRKTTPVGDDNVTFVLAQYGDLLSSDTIDAAAQIPLCVWDFYEHEGGIVVGDPSDFYLGFMTPESKTADGIPRYGWYHLSIADDLSRITLLDSGVGLYGEGVYVGIGAIPEPSATVLLLVGFAALLLRRDDCGRSELHKSVS